MALKKTNQVIRKNIALLNRLRPSASDDLFTIKSLLSQKPEQRFAVITPTKITPKAVKRNEIKRFISEILRKNLSKMTQNFNCLVYNRQKELIDKKESEKHLLVLLKKSGILTE